MHSRPASYLKKIIKRLRAPTLEPVPDDELRDAIRDTVAKYADYLTPTECMNIGMVAEYHVHGHRDLTLLTALVES